MATKFHRKRTIVITGGGIGRATALLCAGRGDNIAILDKNAEAAEKVAAEALKHGSRRSLALLCDVTVEEQVENSFENDYRQARRSLWSLR